MKFKNFSVLVFIASLLVLGSVNAESTETKPSAQKGETSVLDKVGNAIKRGAKAAEHGIQRGIKATEHGIDVGTKAAAHGIDVGTKAAAKGVERGAKATARVAKKVAGSSDKKSEQTRSMPPSKQ